jgi:hydrogenase maturation factor
VTFAPKPQGDHAGHGDACGVGDDGCITCGDVALPLQVQRVDTERMLALCVNDEGQTETVEIALVGEVAPGDELLVHAGTAIAHLGQPASYRNTPGREAGEAVRL